MVKWSGIRIKMLGFKERIQKDLQQGIVIPDIYKRLVDEHSLDMKLETFRKYAYEFRDELMVDGKFVNNVFGEESVKKFRTIETAPEAIDLKKNTIEERNPNEVAAERVLNTAKKVKKNTNANNKSLKTHNDDGPTFKIKDHFS